MSTEIEQRVVEMRFDNKHFEKNVGQTMTTLEKLKAKLNLSGASKGLENLNRASNNVNMSGLAKGVETVGTKFSAMEVIGVTALANITNSAVNAGKRIAAALTIDPIKTGFKEYETQINAVQTILANTQKEGTDIAKVNEALDELNKYADMTIYNFTEMTRNIGTFTAAGVKLDDSVKAIKGIANLAAVSGSTSQQASTAMYQLSQALSSGTVKLMDWNSVVNAGMGGQVFQDALKETARVHGIAIDKIIKDEGSFRNSLQNGWLTAEILTETLEKFTYSAEEGTEEWNNYIKALKQKGYTEAQAKEILKLGNTATDAATKVKTFTQLWDVLKEAAQSGWAQTWRIIVGDFEEAKALFTPLANFLTGMINKISTARNKLLEGALSFNPFTALLDKLENSGIGKVVKKVSGITKSLEEYQKIVNAVWRGNYNNRGDNPDRYDLLTKEGWNPRVVQNLVNKGYKYKLTVEDIEKAEKKWGVTTTETIKKVDKLTDAQLRNAGLTEEEIELYRQLEKESKRTGKSIEEIIASMNQKDGRTLLIESFKNVGSSIAKILNAIGEAWNDAFGLKPIQLYNFIAGLNEFSTHLKMSDRTAENLTRTLKGVFAIVDLISMVIGGGLRIAFTILKTVLGMFNLDILQFTAILGDAIVAFRDWVEAHNPLVIVIQKVTPLIIKMGKAIGKFAKQLWELPAVQKFVEKIVSWFKKLGDIKLSNVVSALKSLGKTIKNVLSNINDHFDGVPGDILSGLANGLKNGATKVINSIITLAKNIINKFKEILGIHSPSKVFFAIGGFIIAGLIGGLLSGSGDIGDTMGTIAGKVTELFQNTDWGKIFSKIFTGGMSIGLLMVAKNLSDSLKNFSSLAGGLGSMFDGVGDVASAFADNMKRLSKGAVKVMKGFANVMNGIAFKKTAEGVKELAWSMLIIAASVALLASLDTKKMESAVKAVGKLALILGVLSFALAKVSQSTLSLEKGKGLQIKGTKTILFSVAAALLAMALTIKTIGKLNPDQMKQGTEGLTKVVLALGVLIFAYGKLIKGDAAQNMDKAAKMISKIGGALLMMVIVVKLSSLLKPEEMENGAKFVTGFALFIAALVWVTKSAGANVDKVGKMISKISWSLILMVAVVKLASKLKDDEIKRGTKFLAGFAIFTGILVALTKLDQGQQIAKIGGMMLSISIAMLIMTGVVKIISGIDFLSFAQGALGIVILGGIIAGLLHMVKLIGPQAPKLAGTILALGVAIGILAAVAVVLSLIDPESFKNGAKAIGMLGIIIGLMLQATRGATDVKGTLIGLSIAVGVIAASIAILSFIKPEKLIAPTIAIGVLMGMFALIENQSKHVTGSWLTIAAMAAVIGVLGHVLYKLAKLDAGNVISSAAGLSILLGTLTIVMTALSKIGKIDIKSLAVGIAGIAALCLTLYIVVDVLKRLSGVENVVQNAMALAGFMTVMSLVLLVTAGVGVIYMATGGVAALGLLGMVGIIATLYLLMGALAIMSNISDTTSNLDALTAFLKTMTAILIVLAIVGPLALIGVTALAGLTGLMAAMGIFAVAVGALMEKFPALQSFLNTGLPILIQLAGGIGQMIGAFVSGIMTQVASSLPIIGTMLSQFMINAMPFILGAQLVNKNTLIGVGILAAAILALTVADLIEGVTSFLSGGESFATLGTELSKFMTNALPFVAIANTIKPSVLTGIKSLAEAILIITGANLIDGLNKLLGGESSLETFGSQLVYLGQGLNNFITAVGPISDEQVLAAKNAASIIKTLATAAKEIPNTGGLLGSLVGENDMGTWVKQLPLVAEGIVGFTNIITKNKIGEDSIKVAETAASIITTLAKAASEIPNTGGLLASLIGDNDLSTFASGLPDVGEGIVGFVTAMADAKITEDQAKVANTAAKIIKTLAKASNDIPNTGGVLAALVGDNDLSAFAKQLPTVGSGIAGFAEKLGTFKEDKLTTVKTATSALKQIVNLGKLNLKDFSKNMENVGPNLEAFAGHMINFIDKFGVYPSASMEAAKTNFDGMLEMITTAANTNVKSLKTFGSTLKDAGVNAVTDFVGAFKGQFTKLSLQNAVKGLTDTATNGLTNETFVQNVKSAGMSFTTGFANGIKYNTYLATNAGSAIGKAALKAAKEAIDSNSPSKEAMKIGNYFGQGLVIGINQYKDKTYDTAYSIGDDAKSGLTRAVSRISSVIDSNIDTQPTIRPVLDLSDVESGAGYLNTMFNNGPSIGVMTNLRAISSNMEARRQNGINNDVVTAIDDLRKDLGNIGGTTNNYNVNGVSYADTDTDINNAVKTLVRAAIVERRT